MRKLAVSIPPSGMPVQTMAMLPSGVALVAAARRPTDRLPIPLILAFRLGSAGSMHLVLSSIPCWPSQIDNVEKHFSDIATERSKLLICYGQDILKCMVPQ